MLEKAIIAGVGIKEFWDCSLEEIEIAINAYHQHLKDQQELQAWVISYVTAPHVKKPLSINDILGKQPETQPQIRDFGSVQEYQKHLRNNKRQREYERFAQTENKYRKTPMQQFLED